MTKGLEKETSNDALCLSDLAELMQRMLQELSREINSVVESTISLIQSQLALIHEHLETSLTHINKEMKETTREMERIMEANQRNLRRNELVVYGIPCATTENLKAYFVTICSHLGYSKDHIPVVHLKRLGSLENSSTNAKPILIEFAMYSQRTDFFAKYLHTCKLSLNHIGINSKQRIFINENLTPMARRTLSTATRMKREGTLRNVSVKDGVIHVVLRNSTSCIVNNEDELLQVSVNN